MKQTITYKLKILDPCLDKNFVDFNLPSQTDNISYPVTKGTQSEPVEFYIGLFEPTGVYQLCGSLTSKVMIDSTLVTDTTSPVAYDIATGILTVYSADQSLIETRKQIEFFAFFDNYEEQTKKQVNVNLDFLDPCKDKELV